jgi:topoisomerase-4 subunit A
MGNILTKNDIQKISLKTKGGSTLGGRQVWFDRDVLRLNYDNRGEHLGEFLSEDLILIISAKGDYYTSSFDLNNHYEKDILVIEKFDSNKVWSVALWDAEQKFYYLKRFQFEPSQKLQNFLGDNSESKLMLMTDVDYPRFEVVYGGNDAYREALVVDAEEFISVKSFKAKGKRLTTFEVETINELEPVRFKEKVEAPATEEKLTEDEIEVSDMVAGDEVEVTDIAETETEVIEEEISEVEEIIIPAAAEIVEPKVSKEKVIKVPKEKPAKTPKKETDQPDETIDSKKNTDDPNGQLTLF